MRVITVKLSKEVMSLEEPKSMTQLLGCSANLSLDCGQLNSIWYARVFTNKLIQFW